MNNCIIMSVYLDVVLRTQVRVWIIQIARLSGSLGRVSSELSADFNSLVSPSKYFTQVIDADARDLLRSLGNDACLCPRLLQSFSSSVFDQDLRPVPKP